MSFIAAPALWLLGLSAVVAVVYFLKRQSRTATVSTLFLWEGIEKRPSSALRLNWRQLLSLILQLIALIAIVLGLSQPVLFSSSAGVANMAILIDSSASMRANDVDSERNRYSQAVEAAHNLLNENPAAEVMVIGVRQNSEIISMPSRNHNLIKRSLDASEPSFQGDGDLSQLFGLLESQETREFERVVLISDKEPEIDVSALGWELMTVGDGSSFNTSLTHFSVREQPETDGYDIYLVANNSSDEDQFLPLSVYAENELVLEQSIVVPAGENAEFTYEMFRTGSTRFRAELGDGQFEDQWTEDNRRYAIVPTPTAWKILWVGPENVYLTRFLELSEEIELHKASAWNEEINPDAFDVVILNDVIVDQPLAGRYILINSGLSHFVAKQGSIEVTDDSSMSVRENHPFLHNIDPTIWRFLDVPIADVDPRGSEILSIADQPVLYLFEGVGLKLSYLGLSLDSSNVVLSIEFPILIYRIISWLAPRSDQSTALVAGDEIPIQYDVERTTIIDSSGVTCDVELGNSNCGGVNRPGFYQVFHDGIPVIYAVNSNPAESIVSDFSVQFDGEDLTAIALNPSTSSLADIQLMREIWPYLIAIGLLFLLIEFVIFDQSLASLRNLFRRKSL